MTSRRLVLALLTTLPFASACGGGGTTRLRTVKSPKGAGPLVLRLLNASDTTLNNLYVAETAKVNAADWRKMPPGSPKEDELWGKDLLGAAVGPGQEAPVEGVGPGRWDFRATDREGREQHVTGVKLGSGGEYVLELHESGWRVRD